MTSSNRLRILGLISLVAAIIAVVLVTGFRAYYKFPSIDSELALVRVDGATQSIGDFRGKPLLVAFWSPSCVICMHEVEGFNRLYQKLEGGSRFEMLGVSMHYDRPDWVIETMLSKGMTYPIYMDLKKSVGTAFGDIVATPTTFILDAKGNIVFKHAGALDFKVLEQKVKQYSS